MSFPMTLDVAYQLKLMRSAHMAYAHGQSKKILLVYDNPEYCELLEFELTRLGFDVHTSKSLQTALMMIRACCKIDISYQWILVHNNLENLADPDFSELQKYQRHSDFDIIYFHDSLIYDNVGKLSNKNNHVVPFSKKTCFNAFISAIRQIISSKEILNNIALKPHTRQRKLQVLLVEDNDIGRLMAKTLLESLDLEVTEVCNGQEGLEALDLGHFDLLLTDILMPVMNGLDMVRTIRNSGQNQLPIIVMSANAEANWADSFFSGANGFLVKPFNADVLEREVNKWLPTSQSATATSSPATLVPLTPDLKKLEHLIDIQAGINRSGGQTDTYCQLLRYYYDEYINFGDQLKSLLHAKQRQQAIELVHSLRGAAGNLGAAKVELLAGKLEHDLNYSEQPPSIEALNRVHQQLVKTLAQSFKDLYVQEEYPAGSLASLQSILEQLLPLVENHQARPIKAAEEQLATYTWPPEVNNEIANLLKRLKGFQYSAARQQLVDMLSGLPQATEKSEP